MRWAAASATMVLLLALLAPGCLSSAGRLRATLPEVEPTAPPPFQLARLDDGRYELTLNASQAQYQNKILRWKVHVGTDTAIDALLENHYTNDPDGTGCLLGYAGTANPKPAQTSSVGTPGEPPLPRRATHGSDVHDLHFDITYRELSVAGGAAGRSAEPARGKGDPRTVLATTEAQWVQPAGEPLEILFGGTATRGVPATAAGAKSWFTLSLRIDGAFRVETLPIAPVRCGSGVRHVPADAFLEVGPEPAAYTDGGAIVNGGVSVRTKEATTFGFDFFVLGGLVKGTHWFPPDPPQEFGTLSNSFAYASIVKSSNVTGDVGFHVDGSIGAGYYTEPYWFVADIYIPRFEAMWL